MEQEYTTSILESMLDAVIVANPNGTIRTVNRAALELLGYAQEELVGQSVGRIFEEEEEEEEEFFRGTGLARLVREGAARDVEMTLVAKSGERIPVVFNGSVIRDDEGDLRAVLGVARDMRQIMKLIEETQRRAERLALVNSISATISSGLELDRVLQASVRGLATIFEVDRWGVLLFDQQLKHGHLVAQRPTEDGAVEEMTFPLEGSELLEWIMAVRQPVAIPDVREVPLPARIGEALERRGIKSMLIAPLLVKEEVAGLILLSVTGEPREFTSAEAELAQTIANQVSIAIENARLFSEVQKEKAELERFTRVAVGRELRMVELKRENERLKELLKR
jgi:PAS domain S-box-containing protein